MDYQSEESEESSPSALEEEEEEQTDISLQKVEKTKQVVNRPHRSVTPSKDCPRRPIKVNKPEKNELTRSPEAYFRIGGISVFSFNDRAKSSENIFKNGLKNICSIISKEEHNHEKIKIQSSDKSNECKTSKLILFNPESIPNKTDIKISEKKPKLFKLKPSIGPSMEKLYQAWIKSKSHLFLKPKELVKLENIEIPTIKIKKAKLHSLLPKT